LARRRTELGWRPQQGKGDARRIYVTGEAFTNAQLKGGT